jgi:hypothetical protein
VSLQFVSWGYKQSILRRAVASRDSLSTGVSELPDITPSLNPAFEPMKAAEAEAQATIWSRILYFAMSVSELGQELKQKDVPRRLPILLVSKTFNVRCSVESREYADVTHSDSDYLTCTPTFSSNTRWPLRAL